MKHDPYRMRLALIKLLRNIASALKKSIKRDSLPYKYLRAVNRSIPQSEHMAVLDSFARLQKQVYFVQIGAADGMRGDPIHNWVKKKKWSGIIVEPVPYLFTQLKQNYAGHENLILENVAISDKDEEIKDFWYVRQAQEPHNLPIWYDQLGSFSRDVILRVSSTIPGLENMLVKQHVHCVSLKVLFSRHNVKKIDLLLIDTEGYDFEIIKQFDFASFQPKIIMYEHKHLSVEDQRACNAYVQSKGYRLIEEDGNTLAFF